MTVLLIAGFRGSGKDEVADYLEKIAKERGIEVYRWAFADKIRETLMETFKLRERSDYDNFKRSSFKLISDNFMRELGGRDILRTIGMAMRSCNERVFLDDVIKKVNEHQTAFNIITDLRFKNELDWAREKGYDIIKVKKRGIYSDGHISESGIKDCCCSYVIHNDGTKEDLWQECIKVFKNLTFYK